MSSQEETNEMLDDTDVFNVLALFFFRGIAGIISSYTRFDFPQVIKRFTHIQTLLEDDDGGGDTEDSSVSLVEERNSIREYFFFVIRKGFSKIDTQNRKYMHQLTDCLLNFYHIETLSYQFQLDVFIDAIGEQEKTFIQGCHCFNCKYSKFAKAYLYETSDDDEQCDENCKWWCKEPNSHHHMCKCVKKCVCSSL